MSGGSMDYLHERVANAHILPTTPLRRAFIQHLKLVAKALRDIEWVDSGDCGAGDEEKAIRAVLHPGAELVVLVDEARQLHAQLSKALKK